MFIERYRIIDREITRQKDKFLICRQIVAQTLTLTHPHKVNNEKLTKQKP